MNNRISAFGCSLLILGAAAIHPAQADPPASITNTGTISGGVGIRIGGAVGGDIRNEGVITGSGPGISIGGPVQGNIVNDGTIHAGSGYGIDAQGGVKGAVSNTGTIEAPAGAINLGSGDAGAAAKQ